ncbi:LysR family transcriptional regulator [Shewanella intestini]|uniref:LysR family transcriptional regulator n=1 Tax=Shewanella intestini TaxID=2017544 RepID=A0ABS5HZK6_9GAMM|nr:MULTISPECIES: LysR family transcriptional regulator [Shewanella]MBR9727217.1 LysR family transcriptional regulator [Shewanella intestini]MRG36019.1 LysR family transcriptional regulator [Shewanella sp. XMDDZSB0408]
MNWSIEQLEAFVTAVNSGSFSAAARTLGKAQSRVSTAIANLEVDLGFKLFDRSARMPVLTEQGQQMLIEANAVIAQCERLNSRAMSVQTQDELALTIAIDEAVPISAFETFFYKTAATFPLLQLTILNGSRDDIAQWVDEKKADLGVLFLDEQLCERLEFFSIDSFHQSLIVSVDHPLAKVSVPTIAQLNQYRQLVICDLLTKSKPISANCWHIDSYYHMTSLVVKGLGWALVPEHIADSQWYSGEITELSCYHISDSLLIEMGLVKRRDKGAGNIMNWMFAEVNKMFIEAKLAKRSVSAKS